MDTKRVGRSYKECDGMGMDEQNAREGERALTKERDSERRKRERIRKMEIRRYIKTGAEKGR